MRPYLNVLQWLEALNVESYGIITERFMASLSEDYFFNYRGKKEFCWKSDSEHFAFLLFGRVFSTTFSIERLLPKSRLFDGPEWWDESTICTLIRTIIDSYCALYYLAIDRNPKEERVERVDLWALHYRVSRMKIMKGDAEYGSKNLMGDRNCAERIRSALKSNSFFRGYKHPQQEDFLKGKKAVFLGNSVILKKAGVQVESYEAFHTYLSNHVHSRFFFTQRSFFMERDKTKLARLTDSLMYATLFVAFAIRDFTNLFHVPIVDKRVSEIIAFHEEHEVAHK